MKTTEVKEKLRELATALGKEKLRSSCKGLTDSSLVTIGWIGYQVDTGSDRVQRFIEKHKDSIGLSPIEIHGANEWRTCLPLKEARLVIGYLRLENSQQQLYYGGY